MRTKRHFTATLVTLATLSLLACQQSQPPTQPKTAAESKASST